jgi:hypothetical protein
MKKAISFALSYSTIVVENMPLVKSIADGWHGRIAIG